jgi:hypothetical protein
MSKARIPPPPIAELSFVSEVVDLPKAKPARSRLPATPKPKETRDNLSVPSDGLRDLNFKVSPEFHRLFKGTAVAWGMSMKELLEASFKTWREQYGNEPKS